MRLACALFCCVGALAQKRLIEFNETSRGWFTGEEVDQLAQQRIQFMDVTEHAAWYDSLRASNNTAPTTLKAFPSQLSFQDLVKGYLPTVDSKNIAATITKLSSYKTRYYTTQTGADAVAWLLSQYQHLAGARTDVSFQLVEHTWLQPSLIVRIEGSDLTVSAQTVILGGHIDSINNGAAGVAPGADDDASGSSTVLEVFRVLMANGFVPRRTVEFHAYAAEETGLRGSQVIARDYKAIGRQVYSMLQFDMVCYPYPKVEGKALIGLIEDYTSANLNSFLKLVMTAYVEIGFTSSLCGYACSDHASFTNNGFDASFTFESAFENHNPYIHTANDVIANCDMKHVQQYGRLGVGYIVELSS
jgi:leucyl aminopeptidase